MFSPLVKEQFWVYSRNNMATLKSPKTVEVNLLPSDDLEGRPGGKFLKWALSWGKRIVITVEAVVILAFLSRFWLDTTVADLTEQITQKKNVLDASANFEKKFRATQMRIDQAKKIEKQVSLLSVLDKARALIPTTVTVSAIALTNSQVSLTGVADEQSLALLVSAFKKSADFTDLTVEKISKVGQGATIDFSMKATYVWQ